MQVPRTAAPAREFPFDPWYYYLIQLVGLAAIACAVGLVIVAAIANKDPSSANDYQPVFVAVCSGGGLFSGATVLLLVDIARNLRRLRLHADWNAGIR